MIFQTPSWAPQDISLCSCTLSSFPSIVSKPTTNRNHIFRRFSHLFRFLLRDSVRNGFFVSGYMAVAYTRRNRNGIYIIIFIDNSETTTMKELYFSLRSNQWNLFCFFFAFRNGIRDLISIMIAAWCYLLHISIACSLFPTPIPPHTHGNPIIPKQIFCVIDNIRSDCRGTSVDRVIRHRRDYFPIGYWLLAAACSIIFIDYVWGLECLEFCFDGRKSFSCARSRKGKQAHSQCHRNKWFFPRIFNNKFNRNKHCKKIHFKCELIVSENVDWRMQCNYSGEVRNGYAHYCSGIQ